MKIELCNEKLPLDFTSSCFKLKNKNKKIESLFTGEKQFVPNVSSPPFSVWVIDFCFRISPTVFLSLDTCATDTMKFKEETNELTALEGCQNTKSYKFKTDLA